MAKVVQIGPRLYGQKLYYETKKSPLVAFETTTEVEEPFRMGRCLVFRIPFTRIALIVGIWLRTLDESSALSSAIGYRVMFEKTTYDPNEFTIEWKADV